MKFSGTSLWCRLGLLMLIVALPRIGSAQTSSGSAIGGVVRDASGGVLPGVSVEASSPALIEKIRTVVTDGQGQYKVIELLPGTYTVTFTLPGFTTVKREGIELTSGFTATVNADLKVGGVEETITVSGASPVVDTHNVRTQTVLSRETLDTLPTNREILGLVALTVGVTSNTQDVGGNQGASSSSVSIHGSDIYDARILMDGMVYGGISIGGGGPSMRTIVPNQMAYQETTLETSGTSAEGESGGVLINYISKDGANRFSGSFLGSYTNHNLQNSNLSDEVIARGLTTSPYVDQIWDWGGAFGGPIKQDKLWFFTAHRWWGTRSSVPGSYYNTTPHTLFYKADLSNPGLAGPTQQDSTVRINWQAAAKHKISGSYHSQQLDSGIALLGAAASVAPEAASDLRYTPNWVAQTTWTYPRTNRLLFESGITFYDVETGPYRVEGVTTTDMSVNDLGLGVTYGSRNPGTLTSRTAYGLQGQNTASSHYNGRASAAYVTGSHAFKAGIFFMRAKGQLAQEVNNALTYTFRNQAPVSLTEWASPLLSHGRLVNMGLYGQDQWTVNRLTLNLGVRFDSVHGWTLPEDPAASRFLPARHYDSVDPAVDFNDVSPRFGAAYDLFGKGKTSVKAAVGRYVYSIGMGNVDRANPANLVVTTANRTWNDQFFGAGDPRSGNYVPDCVLENTAVNGECGALDNARFGQVVKSTNYSNDVTSGFGNRTNSWQASTAVQQELWPGAGLEVGYFWTSYSNREVTDNLALSGVADYNSYCITAPTDPRLGDASGRQLCGLYDVVPSQFGKVDNLVTLASDVGKRTEGYQGIDANVHMRFLGKGLLTGGVSTGKTVMDACDIAKAHPEVAASLGFPTGVTFTTGPSLSTDFCRVERSFAATTQLKLAGIYPLPVWGLQVSANLQNLPGAPILATYTASNAVIAPSLGRNLSACSSATAACTATVSIPLIAPYTQLEDRLTQVDLRFTKGVRVGRSRIEGNFDIYNAFNASTVLGSTATYTVGATNPYLRPSSIVGARLFKFSAKLDF